MHRGQTKRAETVKCSKIAFKKRKKKRKNEKKSGIQEINLTFPLSAVSSLCFPSIGRVFSEC